MNNITKINQSPIKGLNNFSDALPNNVIRNAAPNPRKKENSHPLGERMRVAIQRTPTATGYITRIFLIICGVMVQR